MNGPRVWTPLALFEEAATVKRGFTAFGHILRVLYVCAGEKLEALVIFRSIRVRDFGDDRVDRNAGCVLALFAVDKIAQQLQALLIGEHPFLKRELLV